MENELSNIINRPVTPGSTPEGSFPAIFIGWKNLREMESKYGNGKNKVVDASFALRLSDGRIEIESMLVNLPPAFLSNGELAPKSNLSKLLVDLAAGDSGFVSGGSLREGVTLNSFVGRKCIAVNERDGDWVNLKKIGPAVEGLNYPSETDVPAEDRIPF